MTPTTIAAALRGIAATKPREIWDENMRCNGCGCSYSHDQGCKLAGGGAAIEARHIMRDRLLALADEIEAS